MGRICVALPLSPCSQSLKKSRKQDCCICLKWSVPWGELGLHPRYLSPSLCAPKIVAFVARNPEKERGCCVFGEKKGCIKQGWQPLFISLSMCVSRKESVYFVRYSLSLDSNAGPWGGFWEDPRSQPPPLPSPLSPTPLALLPCKLC